MPRPQFRYVPKVADDYVWREGRLVTPDWSLDTATQMVLAPVKARGDVELPRDLFARHSGLFRDFARLAPEPEAILGFARSYGNLMGSQLVVPIPLTRKDMPKGLRRIRYQQPQFGTSFDGGPWELVSAIESWRAHGAIDGVPLSSWSTEIGRMRLFVELWDAIASKDKESLHRMIRVQKKGGATVSASGYGVETTPMATLSSNLKPDDVIGLATFLFEAVMRLQLPRAIRLTFDGDIRAGTAALQLKPQSLIDALWTQFALAISEGRKFVECEHCGRTMQISPDTHRTNRKLCSNACKTSAYRKRQRRAIELHDQGWNVRRIAADLGSDAATVKGWLDDYKSKGQDGNGKDTTRSR